MRVLRYRLSKIQQHCQRIIRLHGSAKTETSPLQDFLESEFHPYEFRDREIIDYEIAKLKTPGGYLKIRGPLPKNLAKGQYAVCIGAAQTFGCYVERPFPALLSEKIGFPILNLGQGGASSRTFLEDENLIKIVNDAKFVIFQIMAARGYENSMVKMAKTQGTVIHKGDNRELDAFDFYQNLTHQYNAATVKKIVSETRENWIQDTEKLLSMIKRPVVLLWFSQRTPAYTEHYNRSEQLLEALKTPFRLEKFTQVGQLFEAYPQLINDTMVRQVKPFATQYVEAVTDRGWPQMLRSKISGARPMVYEDGKKFERRFNGYPSPEMHEDAATALEPVCKQYMKLTNHNE